MFSIAYVALCQAATTWRTDGGASFRTHAGQRIRGALVDEARLRLGRTGVEQPNRIPPAALRSLEELDMAGLQAGTADASLEDVESRDFVDALLAGLPERERFCLTMYTYGDLSQLELGELLGISASRVSQLITQAGRRILKAEGPDARVTGLKADRRRCNDLAREGRMARPRVDPQRRPGHDGGVLG